MFNIPATGSHIGAAIREAEALRTIGTIIARDDAGNTFEKTAIFSEDYTVISFGGFVQYTFDTLMDIVNNPTAVEFVIDIGGRNHKDVPGVSFLIADLRVLMDKALTMKVAYDDAFPSVDDAVPYTENEDDSGDDDDDEDEDDSGYDEDEDDWGESS